ncbi:hypothetical protein FT643_07320 [Ketobacter sp. MCCC 1A13808]|uniref:hypothetical protein n=1 Tax=Ketobacter sp. MCCC 1A13808 TaxID=2602738 RepID=UPI000F2D7BFF|nr:hypothetical protein [Ketobacter sp. MCCC 1A13808]MVF11955.1 hypothetical protein [Ketobacter sp. MCCC 1A13808]RLP52900.1 MAG: hypothetical protein D6160_18585 [Ketobacter sp.]
MDARQAQAAHAQSVSEQQELNEQTSDGPESLSVWMNQAVETGSSMVELFRLELKLALGDAQRMFFLFILAVPLLILIWISLAALIGWLVFDFSQVASLGLLTFLLLHVALLMYFVRLWRRYKRSLTLPLSRQHLQSFLAQAGAAEK